MSYTVRELGMSAWEDEIPTLKEAIESRRCAINAGLSHAVIVNDDLNEVVPLHKILEIEKENRR